MDANIIDVLEEAIGDYLSDEVVKYGNRHPAYVEMTKELNEAKGRHCHVEDIFDLDRAAALSKEECETLIESLILKHRINNKELEIAYVLGFRDCITFGRRFDPKAKLKQEDVTW